MSKFCPNCKVACLEKDTKCPVCNGDLVPLEDYLKEEELKHSLENKE